MDIKCPSPKYTKNFLDMCYESELTPNISYLEMIKDFAYFEALQSRLNFIHRCPMGTVIESLCYLEVALKTTKNGLWYVVVAHLPPSLTKLNDFCVIGPTNLRAINVL
jgi:hypothetical protein